MNMQARFCADFLGCDEPDTAATEAAQQVILCAPKARFVQRPAKPGPKRRCASAPRPVHTLHSLT